MLLSLLQELKESSKNLLKMVSQVFPIVCWLDCNNKENPSAIHSVDFFTQTCCFDFSSSSFLCPQVFSHPPFFLSSTSFVSSFQTVGRFPNECAAHTRTQRGFSPLADRAECSGNVKGHLVDEYEGRPLITTLSMTNKEVLLYQALPCIVLWRTRDILSLAARTPASEPALEKLFVWP